MAAIQEVDMAFAKRSYLTFVKKKLESNDKNCYISSKVPRSDGYIRFSITKGSTKQAFGYVCGERSFYLHHLAWYATGHIMPTPVSQHLSHLCGDSRCYNPDHLVVESPQENNQRKGCLVAVQCPCPCQNSFWLCGHTPKCIPIMNLIKKLPTA